MGEKVSVVIPTLNTGKLFIDECLNSILSQSYEELEVILVDGYSTDDTWKCICDWKEKDSRVKAIQTTKGVSHQRNVGIDHSTGKYICFVDSDDYICNDYVEHMLSLMKNRIQVVVPKIVYVTYDGKENVINCIAEKDVPSYTINQNNFFVNFDTNGLVNPVKMYDKELIGDTRFIENLSYGEDLMFNYTLASKGYNCVFASNALYYYRRIKGSNSGIKRLNDNSIRIVSLLYNLAKEKKIGNLDNYKGVYQEFCNDFKLFYYASVKTNNTKYIIKLFKYRLEYLKTHHSFTNVVYLLFPYSFKVLSYIKKGIWKPQERD